MSALGVADGWIGGDITRPTRLHVVIDGETSAATRRKAHARMVAKADFFVKAKIYAGVSSVIGVFAAAIATIITSFLAVPNVPLP